MILADNAMAFGRLLDASEGGPSVEAIRSFNELMANHPALDGVIVPLGDGLWVAVKRS